MESLGGRAIISFIFSDSDGVRDELGNLQANRQETLTDILFRGHKEAESKKGKISSFLGLINSH